MISLDIVERATPLHRRIVYKAIHDKGLDVYDVALEAGCDIHTITNWTAKNTLPTGILHYLKMCELLDIDPIELMETLDLEVRTHGITEAVRIPRARRRKAAD